MKKMSFFFLNKKKKKCVDEDVANPASSVGGRVGNTDRQTKKQREKERESCLDCSFFSPLPSAKSRHSAQELAHLFPNCVYNALSLPVTVARRLRRFDVAPALIDDAIYPRFSYFQ